MQIKEKLLKVKNRLPLGGQLEISRRTGITPKTVGLVLSGANCRMGTIIKVFTTASEIIKEQEGILDSIK